MGAKVIRHEVERDITFLQDANVDFISLVRHGANKQAFRIVKQEGGVSENMRKVIQSILLLNDMDIEKLSSVDGLGYLTEAKTDEMTKFDKYNKYVQTDEKKFEKDSLSLVKLGESGYAIVGKLKEDADDKNVLVLGMSKEDSNKTKNVLDVAVPSSSVTMTQTFGDLLHKELSLFLDIVFGVLRQSSVDPKKRKAMVMGAFESFRNFVSMGLDTIGKAKVDMDKIKVDKLTINKGEKMNKEEILKLIKDGILEILPESVKDTVAKSVSTAIAPLKEALEKLTKDATAKPEGKDKKDKDSTADQITKMSEVINGMKEKLDKMGGELETQPSRSEKDDGSNETEKTPPAEKESGVFSGLLIKQF